MSRPFRSYAQNFEDVMLYRALAEVEAGFYIDVGAQDPDVDSVSKAFFERGWRGVHIEPASDYAQRLREARPEDIVIEAAASNNASGTLALTLVPETGLSTVEPSVAAAVIDSGREPAQQTVEVRAMTLSQLVQDADLPADVHWLKIDVEGHERAVLEGWDSKTLRPWIILVEATLPNSPTPNHDRWESLILSAGYVFAYFDGLNRFYVEAGRETLMAAFASPPNPFDEIRLGRHSSLCNDLVNDLNQSEHQRAQAAQQCAHLEHQRAEAAQQCVQAEQQRAEAEQQCVQAEQQRAEAEQQCVQAEQQRAEAEQQRAEAEQQRAEAEQQRAQAEQQCAESERQRARIEQEAVLAEHQLAELAMTVDDLRHRLADLTVANQSWEAAHSAMLKSWSWRVTAPLRMIASPFLGVARGGAQSVASQASSGVRDGAGPDPQRLSPVARHWAAQIEQACKGRGA